MELKLHYQYGRVTSELTLTNQEQTEFREAKLNPWVSWTQLMVALDEPTNPRYVKSSDRADSYMPMKQLTKADLDTACTRIMAEIKTILLARLRPAIQSTALDDLPRTDDGIAKEIEAVFPFYAQELTSPPPIKLMVGDKYYELNPSEINAESAKNFERYESRLRALHQSYNMQFQAYKSEFDQRFERLRQQIASNVIVPPTVSLEKLVHHNMIFFARTSGDSTPKYWFQLPFKLNQTMIRRDNTILRLRKEYWMVADAWLTLCYAPNGQEQLRDLTSDRAVTTPVYHAHSLAGNSFCSGTMGHLTLDLTGDVIDQVVNYRDRLQELLEHVNPSSWGTNRHGIAARLRDAYDSGKKVWVGKEDVTADTPAGEVPPQEGTVDIWEVPTSEILAEQTRQARATNPNRRNDG